MPGSVVDIKSGQWLLCRTGRRLCALPLGNIGEVTRLLPIEPFARSPQFILGLTMLRGAPTPVVDAESLFGERTAAPKHLVAIRTGSQTVALAFTAVIGVRSIRIGVAAGLPPLLGDAAAGVVTAIAALDAELLHVLDTARVASDAVLERVAAAKEASQ